MANSSVTNVQSTRMTRKLTLLFAVAGGAAVGNLYWAQPLLKEIADSLDVPATSAGLLVTLTQVGYAVGIFLIVPLGDTLNRRRLIPSIMVGSALALAGSALASNFAGLLIALSLVGLTTVGAQLLTPLASDLARDDERGRVVGTIASGLLTGILLSRTISGLVANAFGWRAIYFAAAALILVLAFVLAVVLPATPRRAAVPYSRLLSSVFSTVLAHRPVRVTLLIGATAFSVFTMFWTGLTFLLSSPAFSYSVTQIGLVGLVGLAGALAAQRAGRLHDRGHSVAATGAALGLALVSLAIASMGSTNIITVLLGVLLLDVAIQAVNVLNQTRLLSVDPAARSRLNTAFVTSNFIGGAVGSALAGLLWGLGGWTALTLGGIALILIALTIWLVNRRSGFMQA